MNKPTLKLSEVQTMDDATKVNVKLCQTHYELVMSEDFAIAFEKILRLMDGLTEEYIQEMMAILKKIRSSEELTYKEGVAFHKLLNNPTFQKTGTDFVGHLTYRIRNFITQFY